MGEVEVFAGHTRKLTKYSRLGASMTCSLTGVIVKIKYKRGETEFVLPCKLCGKEYCCVASLFAVRTVTKLHFNFFWHPWHSIYCSSLQVRLSKSMMGLEHPWSIVAGGLLEGFVWMGMEWIMGPSRQKERDVVLSTIGKRVRQARKSARNQQRMMVSRANDIIVKENHLIHGLIIVEARYGTRLKKKYPWSSSSIDDGDAAGSDVGRRRRRRQEEGAGGSDFFSEDDSDSDSDEEDDVVGTIQNRLGDGFFYPPNIDVRVPLQFLVDNGTLRLSSGIHKSDMLGFCDPSILEHAVQPPVLYIKYSCSGQVYECTFGENENVMLPSPEARELQGAEYLCFRPW